MPGVTTRRGDKGETGLMGGSRVPKDDPRIEAIGSVDELNVCLGLAQASLGKDSPPLSEILLRLQHELFLLGEELALLGEPKPPRHRIEKGHVTRMEEELEALYKPLGPLRAFVLPRGGLAAAHLHMARVVARRAERDLRRLHRLHPLREEVLAYANRISDLLFVLALTANRGEGREEVHPDYSRYSRGSG